MANKPLQPNSRYVVAIGGVLRVYLIVVLAAVAVLAILSAAKPSQAPSDAWVHAIIVVAFAGLLLVRARSARRGSVGALRAVGLISAVLLLANVVLALIPHFLPLWMRVEGIGVAVLMAAVILLVVRERV